MIIGLTEENEQIINQAGTTIEVVKDWRGDKVWSHDQILRTTQNKKSQWKGQRIDRNSYLIQIETLSHQWRSEKADFGLQHSY